MKLPNAEHAIIAPEKLRDYLLNIEHRRGGPKARLLHAFGYRQDEWSRLESDIRQQHLSLDVSGGIGHTASVTRSPDLSSAQWAARPATQYLADRRWIGGRTVDYNDPGVISMGFTLFQDFILTRDLPEHGLRAGDMGTVVERHAVTGREDGYSVELFDMTGRTVAVVVVPESGLRSPNASDRPAVRALAS